MSQETTDHYFPMRAILVFLVLSSSSVFAETEPIVIDLWPGDRIPGPASLAEGGERDLTKTEDRLIAGQPIIKLGHVSKPQAHVYLPPADKANGTGVVICPGGGFSILAWDLEGTEVAEWLNKLGVAAVVLKYRVPTRQLGEDLVSGRGNPSLAMPGRALGPVMDAQRALSLARANAEAWQLNPDRIGVLGFSAGSVVGALASIAGAERVYEPLDAADEAACRVNFAMLIYPGGLADGKTGRLKPHLSVNAETPPMFFVHAADDRVTCLSSTAMFAALKLAGVPAELHIYASGGHGYGLRRTEKPVSGWTDRAEEWMRDQQLLKRKLD